MDTNKKPVVKLVGTDGNAFSIIANCKAAALKAGWSREEAADLARKMFRAGSYDELLTMAMETFDVR